MKKRNPRKRIFLSLIAVVVLIIFASVSGSAFGNDTDAVSQSTQADTGEAATIFMLRDTSKAAFWADADDDGYARLEATGGSIDVEKTFGNKYLRWSYGEAAANGVKLNPSDNIYTGTNTRKYVLEVSVKKGADYSKLSSSGTLEILTAVLGGSEVTFFTADSDGSVYFGNTRVAFLSDSAWTRLAVAVDPAAGKTEVYVDSIKTDCVGSVTSSTAITDVFAVSTDGYKSDICIDNIGMYFSDKPYVLTGKVSITASSGGTVNASSQQVHRPIPTEFATGNGYEDLIYYDEVEVKSVDEFLADYTGTVVYTAASQQVTASAWTAATLDAANEGDLIYVSFKMPSGKVTVSVGGVQQVCEASDTKDFGIVVSCPARSAQVKLTATANVTVSDFEIVNYGSGVSADDVIVACSGVDTMNADAQWRKDAWDSIQKNRKDLFTVRIVDENGNAVSGAEVSMDMFESEFQWGASSGLGKNRLSPGKAGEEDMCKVNLDNQIGLFNTAVTTRFHVANSPNPEDFMTVESWIDTIRAEGMRYYRGHTVLRAYSKKELTNAGYYIPTGVGANSLLDAMKARVRDVIGSCNKTTGIYFNEWDFFNEPEISGSDIRPACLGGDITADYFLETLATAREYGTWQITGKLYYNAAYQGDSDEGSSNNENIIQLFDWFEQNGIDFDGYGMEQHLNGIWDMNVLAASIDEFIDHSYGREVKVTEVDLGGEGITEAQKASFLRDYILLIYSRPEMTGLINWTPIKYSSTVTGDRTLLFDVERPAGVSSISEMTNSEWIKYAWQPMLGVDQWRDVIYNKLWTRESGTTDAGGNMSVRGFFGCYDVTVKVGNKEYTASVDFLEDGVRDYVITIPAQSN